jgi:excisionase family DNA binding protein
MVQSKIERGPIAPSENERSALESINHLLEKSSVTGARLLGPDDEAIVLPESMVRALKEVARALAMGQVVSIVALHQELTTQQAADLLNVSRPYLVRLLDEGVIPLTKTGTHRRVRFEDVMEFRRRRGDERRRSLKELTQMSQEIGLYSFEQMDK